MSNLQVEALINRLQENQVIYQAMRGLFDEIKALQAINAKAVSTAPSLVFDEPEEIKNNQATDFVPSAGTWNVIGTATVISRFFQASVDKRFLLYSIWVDNSTLTVAGTTQLRVALPPGYKVRSNTAQAGQITVGNVHYFITPAWEMGAAYGADNESSVVFQRATLAAFGAGSVISIRATILIPVVYKNDT